jgi:hypothetical protein
MMKTAYDNKIGLPTVADPTEWQKALGNLTVKEKVATRARDAHPTPVGRQEK